MGLDPVNSINEHLRNYVASSSMHCFEEWQNRYIARKCSFKVANQVYALTAHCPSAIAAFPGWHYETIMTIAAQWNRPFPRYSMHSTLKYVSSSEMEWLWWFWRAGLRWPHGWLKWQCHGSAAATACHHTCMVCVRVKKNMKICS